MNKEQKFKDIKVGDTVYALGSVIVGALDIRNNREHFFLPHKVTEVSKAQFKVGSARYRKSDGKRIGGDYWVAKSGDKINSMLTGSPVVTDQSN